jgi:hypothetical protein
MGRTIDPGVRKGKPLYLLEINYAIFHGKFIDLLHMEHFSLFLVAFINFEKRRTG